MKNRHINCLLLWACVLGCQFGFSASAHAATAPTAPPIAYKLSRTDKISISVVNEPDLNVARKTIDVNGNVNLSLVLDVHIAGLTVNEAQTAIENAYKDGRYLRNPQVNINIEEYAPRTVVVGGLVKYPGTTNLPPETTMTLKELISKVGLAETANAKDVRITRTLPDGKTVVIHKNVDGILTGKNNASTADANFLIEPDDTIYVPEKIF
jgi:polysaccharide export outer membrane protein